MTVRVVLPEMLLKAAVMSEEPSVSPDDSPPESIVATAGVSDDQVAWLVKSLTELSEYVIIAVNC